MAPKLIRSLPFRRFLADEHGAFAVMFGVMAIVLIALGGAVVDYVSLEQTRVRAQTALDAAALALQPQINKLPEQTIRKQAEALVLERIGTAGVTAEVDRISVEPESGRLFLGGSFSMPTAFVRLVGVPELGASFSAEAVRGSVNMEISMALDVTGSMGGRRIADLKEAARELVDAVLQANTGESVARIALVPYSQAVNAASYAEALRGPIRPSRPITNITWATGTTKTITKATNTGPVRITSSNHGFQNNDWVYVSNLDKVTHINKGAYQVQNAARDTFELRGTTARGSGDATWGQVVKCERANCLPMVTSNGHGFANGETVVVNDVRGMTAMNGLSFAVSNVTANTLVLNGLTAGGGQIYTGGGRMDCTWQRATEGCEYYLYTTQSGTQRINRVTSCVTERAVNPFNDAAPSVTYVGRNYPPQSDCPSSAIIPLTTNQTTLVNAINALPATGTTAGSLGILWSWYMLSPNFGSVWPNGSQPEPYDARDLLKAAIIMTDGEFNTVHFEGVLSRDSNIGSSSYRHSQNAHNGTPYVQAKAYCDAMRRAKITVYTVGFDIGTGTEAANIMSYCATVPENYYPAANGDQLKEAFRRIARNISALRLSQ